MSGQVHVWAGHLLHFCRNATMHVLNSELVLISMQPVINPRLPDERLSVCIMGKQGLSRRTRFPAVSEYRRGLHTIYDIRYHLV